MIMKEENQETLNLISEKVQECIILEKKLNFFMGSNKEDITLTDYFVLEEFEIDDKGVHIWADQLNLNINSPVKDLKYIDTDDNPDTEVYIEFENSTYIIFTI